MTDTVREGCWRVGLLWPETALGGCRARLLPKHQGKLDKEPPAEEAEIATLNDRARVSFAQRTV